MLAQAIKRRLSKEENQKGFTLIELLAVIVILGIIAVIAIPMIGGIINKSKTDADLATARQLYDASRMYIMGELDGDFKGKTVTLEALKDKNILIRLLFCLVQKIIKWYKNNNSIYFGRCTSESNIRSSSYG